MEGSEPIKSIRDLKIYNLSFDMAMKVFNVSKDFPKEEKYSLTDQIRRSSRSVTANIREGFGKRHYPNNFIRHLVDALGSSEETITWLDFAESCKYISHETHEELDKQYTQLSSMIANTIKRWK